MVSQATKNVALCLAGLETCPSEERTKKLGQNEIMHTKLSPSTFEAYQNTFAGCLRSISSLLNHLQSILTVLTFPCRTWNRLLHDGEGYSSTSSGVPCLDGGQRS